MTLRRKMVGAEVWVEPGHTPAQIDRWFRLLRENGFGCARVLLVWQFLERSPHEYDFTLYDEAFHAAERYGISIAASLQTDSPPAHWGVPYNLHARILPRSDAELNIVAEYVQAVVTHYRSSRALDCWLHLDETCVSPSDTPLGMRRFRDWLVSKYGNIYALNQAWRAAFSDFSAIEFDERWCQPEAHMHYWVRSTPFIEFHEFYREHVRWYLRWVTDRVKELDPDHGIHNYVADVPSQHAARSLDLPSWRPFLDTLGCGVHPPWHLAMFAPEQFALGTSLSCDIVRGAIEPKPFWLTETQGGTILYAGHREPRNLDDRDLAQIFWTAFGAGADRVFYWLLNHRLQDFEAGEWGLLDFQDQPSERFAAIAKCIRTLGEHAVELESSRPWSSPITILLSLETETLALKIKNDVQPGTGAMAHLLEAYSIYQALSECGIPTRIKFLHDFEWDAPANGRQLVILPHATTLTDRQLEKLDRFVAVGNTVFATGLSGIYDDKVNFRPLCHTRWNKVFGGQLRDIRTVGPIGKVEIQEPSLELPAHLWVGELRADDAEVFGQDGGRVTAVRKSCGAGIAHWLPTPIGLGARVSGDFRPLASLLRTLAASHLSELPLKFDDHHPDVVQRLMVTAEGHVTVSVNMSVHTLRVQLVVSGSRTATVWWQSGGAALDGTSCMILPPRATLVVQWIALSSDAMKPTMHEE